MKPIKPEGEFCLLNLAQKGIEGEGLSGRHCGRSQGYRDLPQKSDLGRHVWEMDVTLTPDFVTTKDPLLIGLHLFLHSGIQRFKSKCILWIGSSRLHFCVSE